MLCYEETPTLDGATCIIGRPISENGINAKQNWSFVSNVSDLFLCSLSYGIVPEVFSWMIRESRSFTIQKNVTTYSVHVLLQPTTTEIHLYEVILKQLDVIIICDVVILY